MIFYVSESSSRFAKFWRVAWAVWVLGAGTAGKGEDGIEEKDSDKVEMSVRTLPPSSELEVGFQPRNAGNQEEAKTSSDSYHHSVRKWINPWRQCQPWEAPQKETSSHAADEDTERKIFEIYKNSTSSTVHGLFPCF
jgi:hypothetical protein